MMLQKTKKSDTEQTSIKQWPYITVVKIMIIYFETLGSETIFSN